MKTTAKILDKKGKLLKIQYEAGNWNIGDWVTLHKGSSRTGTQNALYWVFLGWLIDNGLKEHGHFNSMGLHLNLKAHFKQDTTTAMGKSEFGEYVEKINVLMIDMFQMDTSPFWEEHQEEYGQYNQ